MSKLISEVEQVVSLGAIWVRFPAGKPVIVPDRLRSLCLATSGISVFGEEAVVENKAECIDRVEQLVDIMLAILAEGNSRLLTTNREPKHSELVKRAGFEFSKEDREAAWAIVGADNDDS